MSGLIILPDYIFFSTHVENGLLKVGCDKLMV